MQPAAAIYPKTAESGEKGMFGSAFPKTMANGFTLLANIKPGRADEVRKYGQRLAEGLAPNPNLLAPLKLHYLRWVIFDNDTKFMYIGIFDTDFDKYVDDAVMLFKQTGLATLFENLEDFPEDWRENPAAFAKFARDHQLPSFMEYAEYPDVTADEVVKAVKLKRAFSDMLDQMQ